MTFSELILQRESVRDYDPDRSLNEEAIVQIINAGRMAPSAANRQPWQFILVSSEEWLDKIRPCYQRSWFHDAPHILIVKGNRDEAWTRTYDQYNSLETDLTIAMDHMILAAANIGVGTCWIAAFDPEVLRKALNLKEDEEVFAITPLGFSPNKSHTKSKVRKSLSEIFVKL